MGNGKQIRGAAREELAVRLRAAYEGGASIRALAQAHGRSYGTVHRILTQAGVVLRGRGGATRSQSATATVQSPAV